MANEVKYTGGVPLGMVLFIVFLILKLTHVINWSWWWIFSPIWIPAALIFLILIIGAVITLLNE